MTMKARTCLAATALLLASPADGLGQRAGWTASPVIRAGAIDGPGALADIFDIEVASDGRILVSQTKTAEIAIFDSSGTYLRSLGRRGEGPGEFSVLGGLGWRGDTLWAIDFGKLHLFDADLQHAATIASQLSPMPREARMLAGPLLADGTMLFFPLPLRPVGRLPIILATRAGRSVRTLAWQDHQNRSFQLTFPGGQRVTVFDPWSFESRWAVAPDGRSIVVVNQQSQDGIELLRIGLTGDTVLSRRLPLAPRRIPRAVSELVYRSIAERFTDRGITVAAAERTVRESIPVPDHAPPVTQLLIGRDGTIWLRREDLREPEIEWQVFDQAGERIGQVLLPRDLEVKRVQRGRVWGAVRNELDVPFVAVYDVQGG